jgi:hypothetical protein
VPANRSGHALQFVGKRDGWRWLIIADVLINVPVFAANTCANWSNGSTPVKVRAFGR